MSEPRFDLSKLLQQSGMAAQAQHYQTRATLLKHFEKAVRTELKVSGLFDAVEYPAGNLGKGMLLFKPGQKLVQHIWGTVTSRTQPWEPGSDVDIGFFIGHDLVLVVSDRADTPRDKARFIVHINGYVEHLD